MAREMTMQTYRKEQRLFVRPFGVATGHALTLAMVRSKDLMDDFSAAGYIRLRPDDDYVILEFPALDIKPSELDTRKIADYLRLISLKANRDIV